VDVGYQDGGVLVWGVIAPTSDMRKGALGGNYAGATASATVGIGLGANVLVGGLDKSIALQPVSIEGNKGLNLAAGIGAVDLTTSP
jgi:di/tricarboxylate transporter